MPRMENKAVSGKKGSPPQDESGYGDMKIADLFRILCERMDSSFDKKGDSKKWTGSYVMVEDWRRIDM